MRIRGALLGALLALACDVALAVSSVRGLRMSQADDHTRFVLDLSGPSPQTLSRAASPDRLILDLGDSRLAGSLQLLDLAGSPVQRIRSGMFNATDLRVVFDLAVAAEAKSFLLPPGDGFGHRLVLDVYPGRRRLAEQACCCCSAHACRRQCAHCRTGCGRREGSKAKLATAARDGAAHGTAAPDDGFRT